MDGLTRRQKEILDFLVEFVGKNGFPPTIREIGHAFNFKSNRGVVDHLRSLEKKGFIRRIRGSSRAIEILGRPGNEGEVSVNPEDVTAYPLVGGVAAGEPAIPVEDVRETVVIGKGLFRERGDFLLEVKGDSMIDDHIVAGDLLVVKREAQCSNGDVVVALVDGEATVKRYFRYGDRVVLHPANRKYEPVIFNDGDSRTCTIVGRVIGVIRRFGLH